MQVSKHAETEQGAMAELMQEDPQQHAASQIIRNINRPGQGIGRSKSQGSGPIDKQRIARIDETHAPEISVQGERLHLVHLPHEFGEIRLHLLTKFGVGTIPHLFKGGNRLV